MSSSSESVHGGRLVARTLRAHGVSTVFTLSGGHLFSIYDGCRAEGIALVDVRHEQTAAFAAEGWAKVTRSPGVCALTAGPGVTNGMSAIASASQNDSPMLVLGGRAPAYRWGQGSLQEIDHVPFVSPLTRFAATAPSTAAIPGLVRDGLAAAVSGRSGPAFVDFPLDVVFSLAADDGAGAEPLPSPWQGPAASGVEHAAALLREASRPVIMAGTGLYWGRGEESLASLARGLGIPVFLNGLGRGCLPADDPLAFSRTRGQALSECDLALVIGVPMDFRLGFGDAIAAEASVVAIDVAPAWAVASAAGRGRALRGVAGDAVGAVRFVWASGDRCG
jgi:acetolactate synthase-1/2/3 large subunit